MADLHLSAHRHGHRQRFGLRRRDGAGRRRDHGAQRDRPPEDSRFARRASQLPRRAEDLLRRARRRRRRDRVHRRRHDRCREPLREAAAGNEYAAVALQSPNFFGNVDTLPPRAADALYDSGTMPIAVVAEALSLAALATPASWGAQIVVGEAQSFGVPVAYGGPYAGFIASTQEHMRRIPGRLAGKTVDNAGRTAYVLTLQAREQHIRRERATSNICTNQAHCALIATIYLALMGKTGLRDAAALNLERSRELATAVSSVDGYRPEVRRAVLQRVRCRRASAGRCGASRRCRSAGFSAESISDASIPELADLHPDDRDRTDDDRRHRALASALREVVDVHASV